MKRTSHIAGVSLVELLVALGIGLALSLAMATLHARVSHLYGRTTAAADAQDTLRIALATLEYELAHAGYWGLVPDAAHIAGRRGDVAPLAAAVAGDCGPAWAIDLDRPLVGWSGGWPLACAPFAGAAPVSGGLVLRRVATAPRTPDAGVLQVYGDPWGGRLGVSGAPAAPGESVHDLVARAYYVSPRATADPTRPSLRRKTLQRGPRVIDEEMVVGIARMDVALGVDTDAPGDPGHGQPNRFVAPELASGEVVAVRVRLTSDEDARLSLTRTIALRNGPVP
ncbi:MAG TPA: PilW family protein [Gammaproteobacteria bacterium]|nr:PilW family protein [Gammaproteobacteria bacterium]